MPYSKKVIQHFTKPHNQGVIKNADGIGTVGNPVCGDIMKLYIKIYPNNHYTKFLAVGGHFINQVLKDKKRSPGAPILFL